MADLDINPVDVAPVYVVEQFTGPAAEKIDAGQYVRFDTATGRIALGNATTADEARKGGIAVSSAGTAGITITAVRKGLVNLGDVFGTFNYDQDIYLSDTDGALADAAGSVSLVVGTVVPAFGAVTPDKLLRVDL